MKMCATLLAIFLAMSGTAWAKGAIAVDDEAGTRDTGYGLVTGYENKDEALRAALAQCRKAGNDGCRTVAWFETCGSYASSKQHYGAGWGKTEAAAEDMALDKCGSGCRIVVSECE